MPQSKHYCVLCNTHFGGPPENITPKEHANIKHNGGVFVGIENGNYKDWKRKKNYFNSNFNVDR